MVKKAMVCIFNVYQMGGQVMIEGRKDNVAITIESH